MYLHATGSFSRERIELGCPILVYGWVQPMDLLERELVVNLEIVVLFKVIICQFHLF
jgi:hypothetical protein